MTNRDKLIKRAALGDDNATDLLQQIALDSLKRAAGYIPNQGDAERMALTFDGLANDLAHETSEHPYFVANEKLIKYDNQSPVESATDPRSPRINGVPQLPIITLEHTIYPTSELSLVIEWATGRAWVAGSSVLSRIHRGEFIANDIDVFCWTDEDYDTMLAELNPTRDLQIIDKNDRSILLCNVNLPGEPNLHTNLNLVKPCGEQWHEPYHLLKDFDLTPCAVIARSLDTVYAWNTDHITNKSLDVIKLKHPVKTLQRIFKYMNRGYTPISNLWFKLAVDERMESLLSIIAPMTHLVNGKDEPIRDLLWNIAAAVGEIEPATSVDPYYDEEEADYWEREHYWDEG